MLMPVRAGLDVARQPTAGGERWLATWTRLFSLRQLTIVPGFVSSAGPAEMVIVFFKISFLETWPGLTSGHNTIARARI